MSVERVKQRHKSISRIDQPKKRTHGWYVRVFYNGDYYAKFFNDRMHEGSDGALLAAIAYRDELEQSIGKPRTDRIVVKRSRRRTGVIGVRRMVKRSLDKDGVLREHDVYEVTWSPEPKVLRRTSISIDKYGEEEALRRAIDLRQNKEREMYEGQNGEAPHGAFNTHR